MSIGFSSAARNLFLLGSTGAAVVTNFFKTIDQSAGTDGVYLPDEIKYNFVDQKFVLAGSAQDSTSKRFGWFEKRDQAGSAEWDVRVEATSAGVNTTLRAMELDSNDNLIVVGKTGTVPWIAKYSNGGVIDWQSTTNTADVEYTGITSDSNGQYYACGSTPVSGEATAFVEKFDEFGVPGWGKTAFVLGRDVVLSRIAANARGEVVAVGYLEDDSSDKGYIVKIDTNTGEVLWDRTLEVFTETSGAKQNLWCQDVYIDSNDQIYVVGRIGDGTEIRSFLIKYTAEGNIIWQKETPREERIEYFQVKSDGETEQTVVFGVYVDPVTSDQRGIISKYSKNGDLVWRRVIFSSDTVIDDNSFGQITASSRPLGSYVSLDADPSFYYILFIDTTVFVPSETPQQYTFGKISSSGNGLGNFQYADGTGEIYNYEILNVQDKIGRISDGSVRQDTSDLITYPYNATHLLFDDLATQVANKKRQMDSADSFEYSGSPAIRPTDFQELNLLGDNVSGRIWNDTSGKGNNGVASLTEPFLGAGSTSFDGTGDNLRVATSNVFDYGTNNFTIEFWWYPTSTDRQALFHGSWGEDWSIGIDFNGSANNQKLGMWASSSGTSWDMLIADAGGNGITTGTPNQNSWNHIAYVRNGTTFTLYLNGTNVGQVTGISAAINSKTTTREQVIGAWWNSEIAMSDVHGYLSNYRIVIGSALYTSNFTPPTTQLTNIPGTVLLTCQGDTIADASANNFTITANGNAAPTDDGPTHNAAGYWEFDGTDDYITMPAVLPAGADTFTIEAWVRRTGNNSINTAQVIWEQNTISQTTATRASLLTNATGPVSFSGQSCDRDMGYTLVDNEWTYLVCTVDTSDGTNPIKFYLNGDFYSQGQTSGTAASNLNIGTYHCGIGRKFPSNAGNPEWWNGDIGEVRVYPRALTAAQVFQNYNATKSKYINEAPDIAPKISDRGIVYDSNLLLNYDFGNRATYDRAENLSVYSEDFTLNNISTGWRTDAPQYSRATLIANTGIDSPVGTNNASRWQSGNQTNEELIYHLLPTALTVGETYTVSCWIRRVESFGNVQFYLGDNATLDVTSQVDAVPFGQWVRVNATRTITGENGTPIRNYIAVRPNGNVNGGDKTTIDIWGMNVNQGSTPGRYIKTYGTAITAPTTVKNLSSTSYTGTINGSTFNSAGYFEFDGTNDDISVSSLPAFGDNDPITIESWVNADTTTNTFQVISTAKATSTHWQLSYTGDPTYNILWAFAGTSNSVGTTTLPSTGDWHHITSTYNGGDKTQLASWKVYIDGLEATIQLTGSTGAATNDTIIGHRSGGPTGNRFDGSIAEVRIYSRALSATEVSQNFNATRSKYGV